MIHVVQSLAVMVFPALVILGAVGDVASYRIPNWIPLALVAGFAAAGLAAGLPLRVLGLDVAVGAGALATGVAMFALGWIGGGDAKLFAAAALWLGWPALPAFVVFTALAGGGLALALMALRSAPARAFVPAGPAWLVRLAAPGENVPYGVAIAAGALAAFPGAALVKALAGV